MCRLQVKQQIHCSYSSAVQQKVPMPTLPSKPVQKCLWMLLYISTNTSVRRWGHLRWIIFFSVPPQSGLPTRQVKKKVKVDSSKFMTPYLAHSQKMLEQFSHVSNDRSNRNDASTEHFQSLSCILFHGHATVFWNNSSWQNKYRQAYDMSRGNPPAISTETPEMLRIRKAQEQLSEVWLTFSPEPFGRNAGRAGRHMRKCVLKEKWHPCLQVKYRMEGNKARTTSLYGGEAREIAHVKNVTDLISKVRLLDLYRASKLVNEGLT